MDLERRTVTLAQRIAAFALVALLASGAPASADDAELFARVIVDSSVLRSGPGETFRRVYTAHRGETFPVVRRATTGYWFQVELPDGTNAWVLGSTVYNHELGEGDEAPGDDRFLPWLFAPAPLLEATGEIAATFGVLANSGAMMLRPALFFDATFGIEATAGAAVSEGGRLLIGTVGGVVNLYPASPIVPFVVAGGGVVVSDPNADTYLLESGSLSALYGGGGLRIGLRHRLTLRLDVRAFAFFEPDRVVAQEEVTGGLTVFF